MPIETDGGRTWPDLEIDVRDAVLAQAVRLTIEAAPKIDSGRTALGPLHGEARRGPHRLTISDFSPTADILVATPTPATCTEALGIARVREVSVLLSTELDRLPDVIRTHGASGFVVISVGVRRLATELPALSPPELELFHLVSIGCTNKQAAARLSTSEASVKRRLTMLLATVGAERRGQLPAIYQHLGFHQVQRKRVSS